MSFTVGNNRFRADKCYADQQVKQYNEILDYSLFFPKQENCGKCIHNGEFYTKQNNKIVDTETELRGITRPASKCNRFKYSPNCKTSKICTSSFDPQMPINPDPSICTFIRTSYPKFEVVKFKDPMLYCERKKTEKK